MKNVPVHDAGSAYGTGTESDRLPNYALVGRLRRQVADRLTAIRQQQAGAGGPELSADDERQLALVLIREEIAAHVRSEVAAGREPPAARLDELLAEAVEAAIFGAGALQRLLDDPDIENIDINGCDEVFVEYGDERGTVAVAPVAATDEDLIDIVRTLGQYAGLNARPFTPTSPQLDLRLGDGSRLSALMSATERPSVSIRRNRYEQLFLARVPAPARPGWRRQHRTAATGAAGVQTLLELGTVDEPLAAFLEAAVLARRNIVVAGATGAGKTTLLRALIHCVPPGERLITIERALELGLRRQRHLHPNVVEMEVIDPDLDGRGGLSPATLVTRSLRMNPSRVIVGEVLGPEVMVMLAAMTQGNDGSLSTLHARDAADALTRLAMHAGTHDGLAREHANALIAAAIDLVVFLRKPARAGGRRQVSEILEITGSADGQVTRSQIFVEGPDGRAVRDSVVPLLRARELAEHGYDDTASTMHWPSPDRPDWGRPSPVRGSSGTWSP